MNAARKKQVVAASACAGAALSALYIWQYVQSVAQPKLYYKAGALSKLVVEQCTALTSNYYPAPLAFSGNAQTITTVLRQLTMWGRFTRELRAMHDGGCVALDWYRNHQSRACFSPHTPIVLILHGLSDDVGGSTEGYVKWCCEAVHRAGYRAVVLNYRGCGGLTLTTERCYNAVFTDDIHEVVHYLRKEYSEAPLYAVGYSLGALLLAKYLAEEGTGVLPLLHSHPPLSHHLSEALLEHSAAEHAQPAAAHHHASPHSSAAAQAAPNPARTGPASPSGTSRNSGGSERAAAGNGAAPAQRSSDSASPARLTAAVVVSSPYDMGKAARKIAKPWTMAWIYNLVLTFRLRQYARRHLHQLELIAHVDRAQVARARVITEFDAAATCKIAGFDSVEQYYAAGSSSQFIHQIRTPTLFLCAEDDPFLGALPKDECRQNERTVLATTSVGGHCAHLQGLYPLARSWADGVIVQFLKAVQNELHP